MQKAKIILFLAFWGLEKICEVQKLVKMQHFQIFQQNVRIKYKMQIKI